MSKAINIVLIMCILTIALATESGGESSLDVKNTELRKGRHHKRKCNSLPIHLPCPYPFKYPAFCPNGLKICCKKKRAFCVIRNGRPTCKTKLKCKRQRKYKKYCRSRYGKLAICCRNKYAICKVRKGKAYCYKKRIYKPRPRRPHRHCRYPKKYRCRCRGGRKICCSDRFSKCRIKKNGRPYCSRVHIRRRGKFFPRKKHCKFPRKYKKTCKGGKKICCSKRHSYCKIYRGHAYCKSYKVKHIKVNKPKKYGRCRRPNKYKKYCKRNKFICCKNKKAYCAVNRFGIKYCRVPRIFRGRGTGRHPKIRNINKNNHHNHHHHHHNKNNKHNKKNKNGH
jgi:hypothetical protein